MLLEILQTTDGNEVTGAENGGGELTGIGPVAAPFKRDLVAVGGGDHPFRMVDAAAVPEGILEAAEGVLHIFGAFKA